jgi:hypothetical protein
MSNPPEKPKIYHITHIDNLSSISSAGWIESDGHRIEQGGTQTCIGMTEIKRRRLFEIEVSCHPEQKLENMFLLLLLSINLCLYSSHRKSSRCVHYKGGQVSILHLQVDRIKQLNGRIKMELLGFF